MTQRENKDEKAKRLAEQLRANLRRRKAQSRAMKDAPDKDGAGPGAEKEKR